MIQRSNKRGICNIPALSTRWGQGAYLRAAGIAWVVESLHKIELEKALRQMTDISRSSDEGAFQDAETGQILYKGLPGYWRLGLCRNL